MTSSVEAVESPPLPGLVSANTWWALLVGSARLGTPCTRAADLAADSATYRYLPYVLAGEPDDSELWDVALASSCAFETLSSVSVLPRLQAQAVSARTSVDAGHSASSVVTRSALASRPDVDVDVLAELLHDCAQWVCANPSAGPLLPTRLEVRDWFHAASELHNWFGRCGDNPFNNQQAAGVVQALAGNTASSPDLLADILSMLVNLDEVEGSRACQRLATNPASPLGVLRFLATTSHRIHVAGNDACPPAMLWEMATAEQHEVSGWALSSPRSAALANPSMTVAHIATAVDRSAVDPRFAAVFANPQLPVELRQVALLSDDEDVVAHVALNPATTAQELSELTARCPPLLEKLVRLQLLYRNRWCDWEPLAVPELHETVTRVFALDLDLASKTTRAPQGAELLAPLTVANIVRLAPSWSGSVASLLEAATLLSSSSHR